MKGTTPMFMNVAFAILFYTVSANVSGQVLMNDSQFIEQLNLAGGFPEKILSSKSVVLHTYSLAEKEQNKVQEYFQKAGIDAVAYYPVDMVRAGNDVILAFSNQLNKREISNIVFVEKNLSAYRISITKYNGKQTIIDKGQPAWSISNAVLEEALKGLLRTTSTQLKRENLLVNDTPETGLSLDPIVGKRNEFFAVDMKVDLVAIPKFGEEAMDKELEKIITENFPFKFKMVEPGVTEKEMRKQGMLYVLCFVHTRAKVAKELLGYTPGKSETAVVSVTYPDAQPQLKNVPANTEVFKVYFKHIDSGNIFLGNKWDADVTWQAALLNNIRGMKAELRLN
jgi:hypothetical protein